MDSEKRLIDRKSMEKQGAKKRRRHEDCSMDMDRISQLPPPILHHILSFLSQKKAVQTSVLSKTWRYLWNARPNLKIREDWFKGNKENFLSVLGNTLQRYHHQNLSLQQLNLEMKMSDDDPKLVSLLGEWIPIVMLNTGLKTFKLGLISGSPKYFDMPSVVFQAKTLQELDLMNCKLNFDNLLTLSNLRKLHLVCVHISEETLEHILSSCPLIEFLDLNCCELLRTINLKKARNLKHFGFRPSINLKKAPNWFFHNENIYFPPLKSLHLSRVKLSAESFDKFSSKYCPCLENLTLVSCILDFKVFQLSSLSITHLEISMNEKIDGFKGSIDAPNILCFKLSSFFVPSISFSTTSGEWESHISVLHDDEFYDALWSHHDRLNELLKALVHSRIHLQVVSSDYGQIRETDGGGSSRYYEPVKVEVLRLIGFFFPALMNCLLRTCRPRYIVTDVPVDSLRTFLLGELETKSLKKYLEKISMEVWNKNAEEWCRFEGAPLTEDEWSKEPFFRFRLKWREHLARMN